MGFCHIKKYIVLAPDHQGRRLMCPEIFLEFRKHVDVAFKVAVQFELHVDIAGPLHEFPIEHP
jgi:hypothetical protein